MFIFKLKTKIKLTGTLAFLLLLVAGFVFQQKSLQAASASNFNFTAYIVDQSGQAISDGQYEVRFGLYNKNRDQIDPYPSESDPRIWQETQQIFIFQGVLNADLGLNNAFPANIDFSSGDYFIGVRIGTDSEMAPRKKLSAVPFANNAASLAGAIAGNQKGDIPLVTNTGLDAAILKNINQVGTIGSGTWQGAAIADKYIANSLTGKTYNSLTLTAKAAGFSIAGGTASKTLTVSQDASLDQDLLTTSSPTFNGLTLLNSLSVLNGGTGLNAYAKGDLLVADDVASLTRLAIGAAGQVLRSDGTTAGWETLTKDDVGLSNVENIALTTWSGFDSLSTVGTIETGAWQASIVAPKYGGTGLDGSNAQNGQLLIGNGTGGFSLNNLTVGAGLSITNSSGSINLTNIGVTSLAGTTANQVVVSASGGAVTLSLPQDIATSSSVAFSAMTLTNPLKIISGGTGLSTYDSGDLLYYATGETLAKLAKGNDGQVLSLSGGLPVWSSSSPAASHGLLSLQHSDTNPLASVSRGALVTGQGSDPKWSSLALGTTGYFLKSTGTDAVWSADNNTTYSAAGTLLSLSGTTFSLKEGLLTSGKLCTFDGTNLVCNTDVGSVGHTPLSIGTAGNGLSLSDQAISLALASASTTGALSAADWDTFSKKQSPLSGTGFVKIAGTTISYDNTTYVVGTPWTAQGYVTAASLDTFTNKSGNISQWSNDVGYITSGGTAASATTLEGLTATVINLNSVTGLLGTAAFTSATAYQSASANLASLANLAYTTNALVKMTSVNTFALDTNAYLTANQAITLTGDVAGSGITAITTTIGNNKVNGAMLALGSDAQGDVMYYNGTDWVRLSAGTAGQFLKTQGALANPTWAADNNTTYSAAGTLLSLSGTTFSLKEGLLTSGKLCTFDGTNLVCNTDVGSVGHSAMTLSGTVDYLTAVGQQITLNQIDLSTDVAGVLPIANGGTGRSTGPTSNGQLLISSGSGYALSTLTASTGISVANAAGSITISNTGVISLTSTTNQVNVAAVGGDITLSLPQSIATNSDVQFKSLRLSDALTVAYGGTGLSSVSQNSILYASGANVLSALTPGANQMLVTNASGVPNFSNLSADNFAQYTLLAGRTGGQTLTGGSAVTDILKLQGTAGNGTLTSPAIQLKVGDNGATTAMTVLNNGNVGIGTTSPTRKLEVYGTGTADDILLRLTNPRFTGGYKSSLEFVGAINGSGGQAQLAEISNTLNGNLSGTLSFSVRNSSGSLTKVFGADSANGLTVNYPGDNLSTGTVLSYVSNVSGNPIGAQQQVYVEGINSASSLLFLTYNGTTLAEKMRITSGGNVGIGTTAPTAKLQIKGAGTTSSTLGLLVENSGGTAGLTVRDDGNVGIGTAAPTARLQVVQSGTATEANYGTRIENTATSSTDSINKYGLYVSSTGNWDGFGSTNYGLYVAQPSGATNGINTTALFAGSLGNITMMGSGAEMQFSRNSSNYITASDASGSLGFRTGGTNTRLSLDSSGNANFNAGQLYVQQATGNVGIGTTSPGYMLTLNQSADANGLRIYGNNGTGNGAHYGDFSVTGTGRFNLNADSTFQIQKGGSNYIVLSSFGVELGTQPLDTSGTGNSIVMRGRSGQTADIFQVQNNSAGVLLNVQPSGNVGIGTTAPTAKLQIKGAGTTTGVALLTQDSAGKSGLSVLDSGVTTLQGSTATDYPTLGVELLTGGTWTSTDWTGDASGWTHTTGNVSPLSYSATVTVGNLYEIKVIRTNGVTGTATMTIGGAAAGTISAGAATYYHAPKATATTGLVITPGSTFDGTVVVSVKQITAISTPLYSLLDSNGTARMEMRVGTATGNTFIGLGAGRYNTTGNNNSAQGYQALYSNTTGGSNSAQGVSALYSNTTGGSNSAQGYQALYSNTTGGSNSAQGYQALYSNTTGGSNSAQGVNALYSNTTGGYNSAQGLNALYSNTTGSNNSAQGYQAGRYITDGTTANATGSNSLFLGANTKALADGQTNQIVIGDSAIGLGSNTVVLGNSSIVTTALRGNIGIGTTSPGQLLQVGTTLYVDNANGRVGIGGASAPSQALESRVADGNQNAFKFIQTGRGSSMFGLKASDTNLYISNTTATDVDFGVAGKSITLNTSGNVGIGTTNPSDKLHIAASGGAVIRLEDTTSGGAPALYISNGGYQKGYFDIGSGDGVTGRKITIKNGYLDNLMFLDATTGKVGIGTTSPGAKLDILGTSGAVGLYVTGVSGAPVTWTLSTTAQTGVLSSDTNGAIVRAVQGNLQLGANNRSTDLIIDKTTGNVGIGTTGPLSKLDVNGGMAVGSYAGVNAAPANGLIVSGYVGLNNTSTPVAGVTRLGVTGNGDNQGNGVVVLNSTNASSFGVGITLDATQSSGGGGHKYLFFASGAGDGVGAGTFSVFDGTAPGYVFQSSPSYFKTNGVLTVLGTGNSSIAGNVGIGTTSPSSKLSVNGGISAGTYAGTAAPTNGMIISGKVGVGTSSPDSTLKVVGSICATATDVACYGTTAGSIYASNFIVDGTTHLPDYVFEPNYALMSIPELESYVAQNKHLPNVPSANDVNQNGLNLAQMVPAILEKTEENTLYTIANYKNIQASQLQINGINDQISVLGDSLHITNSSGNSISFGSREFGALRNRELTLSADTLNLDGNVNIVGTLTVAGTDLLGKINENSNSIVSLTDNQTKLAQQITGQLADQSLSIADKLTIIGTSLDNLNAEQAAKQIQTLKEQLEANSNEIVNLKSQFTLLQQQASAISQLLSVSEGVIDLKEGILKAKGVTAETITANSALFKGEIVAGVLTIKAIDQETKTVGQATICQFGNAFDEATKQCLPCPAGQTCDGKSVLVKTKAVSANSRIFLTPAEDLQGNSAYVTNILEGQSFIIKISQPIDKNVLLNWWIVEEK